MAQFNADVTYMGASMVNAIVQVTKIIGTKFGWVGTVSVYYNATAQTSNIPTKEFQVPLIPNVSDSDQPYLMILAELQKMPIFTNITNVVQ